MWNRNTDDPLMRIFLDKYHLHLLSIPRENAAVGDLYVHDGKRVSAPGKVTYFLEPLFEMPPIKIGESMADVSGTVSHGVSIQTGLWLLEGFLTALGAGGILNKIRAIYKAKKASAMKFRFAHATRDSVDPLQLGGRLRRYKLMKDHPLYDKRHRYYLATAVARTPSISITAESDEKKAVTIDVGAMKVAGVATGVSVEKSGEAEVTFSGEKSLAFGVELHELTYDWKNNKLKLKMPREPIRVRAPARKPLEQPVKRARWPVFIESPDDDIFLKVG